MSDDHGAALAVVERDNTERMHPMVRAAMGQELDPATLRELLAVQREWEAGEAKRAYTRAMVDLKRDLPSVLSHDQTVDYSSRKSGRTHYTHTSLAAAVDAVIEPLCRHGFSHSWEPQTAGRDVSVTCTLTHSEGHQQSTTLTAPPDTSGMKNPAQAVASTITLLQRYSLLSLLGIATADMHDPERASASSDDVVDVSRNLKAAAALRRYDRTTAEAEKHLDKPVAKWTGADLERLREWLTKTDSEQPTDDAEPVQGELIDDDSERQPGEEG